MSPEDRRRDSFFEHLSDSEQRLGASRHSVFDALFVGILAFVILGGLTLGILRMRTPSPSDQPQGAANTQSVSTPVPAPRPAASEAEKHESPGARPTGPVVQTGKDQKSAPPALTPTVGQSGKDARPYIDASRPGKYTIRDSKVEVEITTLTEKERNEKLDQFKREGLFTDKEIEELKKQKSTP